MLEWLEAAILLTRLEIAIWLIGVMERLENTFPNLQYVRYEVQSPPSGDYNCIGWAACENDRFWWPHPSPTDGYWPPGVPRIETLESFILAFQTLEYQASRHDQPESGFDKVAIYIGADGKPLHMARQLESGAWTSKLGQNVDIEHESLQGLEGQKYGHVVQILKRPIQ
jgi:hypothetical protein